MPEFICCGPNNACINADHIVSMDWFAVYDIKRCKPRNFREWWNGWGVVEVFNRWQVRVQFVNGHYDFIEVPHTAWFENFIGPMPEKPKE